MDERIRFDVGGWTVTPAQNVLERDGRSVKLEPRAIELLVYLAERPGQVVSAEELMAGVWRGRIVEDSAIYKRINELRKAFGDEAHAPRYIETIPKRGYRLVAAVSSNVKAENPSDGSRLDDENSTRSLVRSVAGSKKKIAYLIAGALMLALFSAAISGLYRGAVSEMPILPTSTGTAPAAPAIRPLTVDGGLKESPRLSPDGELAAYAWYAPQAASFDIYVKPTKVNALPINVTEHPAGDNSPVWSPDGKELAFVRNNAGRLSIYVVSWPGRQSRKITDLAGAPSYSNHRVATLTWSPDGRFLVYAEKPSADAPARIMRVDVATLETVALTTPLRNNVIGDFDPSYSPDGRRIAFVRGPASYSTLDIWIMDEDGRNPHRVTTGQWAFVHSLAWLPSGAQLLFTAGDLFSRRAYSVIPDEGTPYPVPGLGENDRFANVQGGRLLFAKYAKTPLRLWEVSTGGAIPAAVQLRDFGLEGSKLEFAPDGQRVAYQRGSGNGHVQIWVADDELTNQRPIATMNVDMFNPYWDAEGRLLLFNTVENGNWDAHVIDIESGRVRPVTTHPADDYYPRFSRDGEWIYFSSNRSGMYEVYKIPAKSAGDGEPIVVTRGGGIDGVESYDGRYLFYERTQNADPSLLTDAPIWRLSLDEEAEPVEVLPSWGPRAERSWVLAKDAIYFLINRPDFTVRRFDLATKEVREVYKGTGVALYPSVSPAETSVFVARDPPATSELWLVENVRQ